VVVSSYSQKENVFKALELGALDFVAKPDRYETEPDSIREQLVSKVLLARNMKNSALTAARAAMESMSTVVRRPRSANARRIPKHVVAIASSTGGPSALMDILSRVPGTTSSGFVIAQHMPDKFTRTFSERLNKRSGLEINEARELDEVGRGTAFVCPGRRCMELIDHGNAYRLVVSAPNEHDRYVPSANRLFASVAQVAGKSAVGVILTGMGDDGVAGARKIVEAGGIIIAESEATAVVYGMPGAAARAGVVSELLPLPEIAMWLAQLDA
jgi:two-component system chemotaxis response regulator CheB